MELTGLQLGHSQAVRGGQVVDLHEDYAGRDVDAWDCLMFAQYLPMDFSGNLKRKLRKLLVYHNVPFDKSILCWYVARANAFQWYPNCGKKTFSGPQAWDLSDFFGLDSGLHEITELVTYIAGWHKLEEQHWKLHAAECMKLVPIRYIIQLFVFGGEFS